MTHNKLTISELMCCIVPQEQRFLQTLDPALTFFSISLSTLFFSDAEPTPSLTVLERLANLLQANETEKKSAIVQFP